MKLRIYAMAGLASLFASAALGQAASGPVPGILNPSPRQETLRDVAEQAKQEALEQLRRLGGRAASQAKALQALQPHQFFERLAVSPVVGPSTIAPTKPGEPTPSPSVNVYTGEGATTGHPAVVLLLARPEGEDLFNVQCSGTLVRQNVVLTAAHCVCWSSNANTNYKTGTECVRGTETRAPASLINPERWRIFLQHVGVRQVRGVIVNEGYRFSDEAVRNDLALLVLEQPVTEINPPTLPIAATQASSWTSGEIIGYGFSAVDRPGATPLSRLVQPGMKAHGEVNSSSCQGQAYLDPAGSLCSLYAPTSGGSQATVCGGDSGGPLWQPGVLNETIGVTSGRSLADCTEPATVAFQMATSFKSHRDWIEQGIAAVASSNVKGIWPAFGDNLLSVLDRRNAVLFDSKGNYTSDGWMVSQSPMKVLATINSSGPISDFSVRDRNGKVLCKGQAGIRNKMPNVDFCWTKVAPGIQFRIIAKGSGDEYLQYVVTTRPAQ